MKAKVQNSFVDKYTGEVYEAGQTTSWESGGTPDSYFKGIMPIATII